jgi:hypothetical protein
VGLGITPRQRRRRFLWREMRQVAACDDLIFVAATPSFGGSIGLFDWLDDLLDPTDLL